MTLEDLLLSTLDDLDERLQLGRGEYDALMIAWLLRKLIVEGRSLVAKLHASTDLEFEVRDDLPPLGIAGWLWIRPTGDGRPTLTVPLSELLGRPVVSLWPGNDPSREMRITARQTIKFLADKWGAVHWDAPQAAWEAAFAEFCQNESFAVETAHGRYTGGVYRLIEIAQVARSGLEPLRVRLVGAQVR